MDAVRVVQGTAVPLGRSDVDTDQIIPSEWLKRVERTGFGRGLFADWRDARDFVVALDAELKCPLHPARRRLRCGDETIARAARNHDAVPGIADADLRENAAPILKCREVELTVLHAIGSTESAARSIDG